MGMYSSGTNWAHCLMERNFHQVEVLPTNGTERGLANFGWKHGDIGSVARVRDGTSGTWRGSRAIPLNWERSASVLLLVTYRNPFSWLQSLHRTPHHAHELYGLDFDTFVRSPWNHYAAPPRTEFLADNRRRLRWARREYLEQHYSHKSVIALRAAGIAITESLKERVQNVTYVNYESFVRAPAAHVRHIARQYDIQTTPEFQPVRGHKGKEETPYEPAGYSPIPDETLPYLIGQIDWDLESVIGYPLTSRAARESLPKGAGERPENLIDFTPRYRCYAGGALIEGQPQLGGPAAP